MASKGDLGLAAETNGLVKSDFEMIVLREGELWRQHNRRVKKLLFWVFGPDWNEAKEEGLVPKLRISQK
ncbi:hypothetical protein SDJN03_01624, partial [Cucurbita argyrosperma subsp. sororia]